MVRVFGKQVVNFRLQPTETDSSNSSLFELLLAPAVLVMPPPDPESAAQASRRRLHPHLHNFSFPIPTKWGCQRVLRCLRGDRDGDSSASGRRSATVPAILNSEEKPGEEVRASFADEAPQPAPEKQPGPLKKRRRRRGIAPPLEMGALPAGTERGCRTRANRQRSEEAERPKFAIALSLREIMEDVYAVTGALPSRRPRKRPVPIQRQLDSLFPGSWLSEVTIESYKVAD